MEFLNTFVFAMASQQGGEGGEGGGGNPVLAFLPLILMFVIFYFLLIRPQQKKQKQHNLMLQALKKGDQVATSGGLIGKVVGVTDSKVVLKVGEDEIKLEFERAAISRMVRTEDR